jgi:hypothetical protein
MDFKGVNQLRTKKQIPQKVGSLLTFWGICLIKKNRLKIFTHSF